mmetsp:Transcript_14702/g.20874  ORF Transcript_14702/g.20874 Transcript_14702/m.20874 type:complete len:149 (-) Transcript_14702:4-450(-)
MGGGSVHDQGCALRFVSAAATGSFFGAFVGAVEAAWKAPPSKLATVTLTSTFRPVGARAAMLGGLASTFAVTECLANSTLGEAKWQGTVVGGMTAGAVLGVLRSNPVQGFVAGAALSLCCIVAEYNDGPLPLSETRKNRIVPSIAEHQ